MAKYDVTRSCGHIETINLIGKHKIREWRLENVEPNKLCEECYKVELNRQHEEENRKAMEAAKEQELPQLVGTEKQISWAETLRQKLISEIEQLISRISEDNLDSDDTKMVPRAVDQILSKTSASWFIENRFSSALAILDQEIKQIKAWEKKAASVSKETSEAHAKIEATVRPECPKTETVAEIRALNNAIEIDFPERRDDFWSIVKKQLNMEWMSADKCWRRDLKPKHGTVQDRAAEAGHRLLAAGFPIRIYDAELRHKVLAGEYKPENTRWIMAKVKGEYNGWFSISWGRDEDFYKAAKQIGGSRYDKPSVVVPAEKFEEVLDFAEMYEFELSDGARKLAEEARHTKESILVAKVEMPKEQSKVVASDKPSKLTVPEEVEIADEFKD